MKGRVCFCFCLPLTKEELMNDLQRPKDFVSSNLTYPGLSIERLWTMCETQIVKPYRRFKKRFNRFSTFLFWENVKFEDYQAILRDLDFETVILFSHCKAGGTDCEQIEFYDRVVYAKDVAAVVPYERSIDIDLSICMPLRLRGLLDDMPGRQFITVSWEERVDLEMGLILYDQIFQAINLNPAMSYSRIFRNVIRETL